MKKIWKKNATRSFSVLKHKEAGFTFVELVVTIGIVLLLLGFVTINLVKAQNSSSLSATLDTLITDIRSQQLKAMVGDTEGRSGADSYGIHFTSTQYILFHGANYSPSDPANFIQTLSPDLSFSSITFSNGNLIFSQQKGEISGYSSTTNSIVLQTTSSGQAKTIQFNQYGVITGVQ